MTAAVRALIPFCFDDAAAAPAGGGLHPEQRRLGALLEKTGFQREGYARGISLHQRRLAGSLLYARLQDDPN